MWNCTHFRHPTDEQLGHVDLFFSNCYNLQSVYFECMMFKALIAKWKVHNISYGASGKPWRHILLKKALHTHNKHPLKEANVFAWMSMISLPCHFLDCSVDNGNMKMVVILSYCGREILIMNA